MKRLGSGWTAVVLVLAAALLRLSLISTARFTADEAIIYRAAVGISDGTAYPELGPNITLGAARTPGPLFYYIVAASQFVSRSPEAANAEVAILGALSVAFLWSAVRVLCGGFPAFVCAFLMAFSPWAVLFSDRIWSPNVLVFLSAVAFWAAARVQRDPKSPLLALLIAVCLAMPQLHPAAPVVWLALLPLVLPGRKGWKPRWLAAGLLAAVVLYLPYLHSELSTGFADLRAFRAENLSSPGDGSFLEAPLYALRFLTLDVSYHELMGYWGRLDEASALRAAVLGSPSRPFSWMRLAAFLCSVSLAAAILRSAYKERKELAAVWRACIVGIAADMILLAFSGKPFYPHYLTPLLPFLFAIAAGLGRRMERDARWRRAAGAALAVFALGGIEASVAISRGTDARNGLATQRAVIGDILADARRERWPDGTRAALSFGFPGFVEGYGALLEESYHSRLGIAEQSEAAAPGAPAPEYFLDADLTLRRLK